MSYQNLGTRFGHLALLVFSEGLPDLGVMKPVCHSAPSEHVVVLGHGLAGMVVMG